jgi:hypothetical protein
MAAPVKNAIEWQWPAEVLAFAAGKQMERYLDPLLQVTRRIFPSARRLKASVKQDPEIQDETHIVFEVELAGLTPAEAAAAEGEWTRELHRIYPSPGPHDFHLLLALGSS